MSDRRSSDLEAVLLRAARSEAPAAGARSRALAAALSTLSSTPAPASAPASATSNTANGSSTSRILLFGGTVCIGVCTLVLVISSGASDVPVTRDPVRAATGAASTATLVISDVPSATVSPTTSASATAVPIASTSHVTTEGTSEIDLVVSAKRSLAAGAPHEALRSLDLHTARYPQGALAEEAEELRVEALVADNNPEGARAVGKAYLARHPHGAYARRITSLIEP